MKKKLNNIYKDVFTKKHANDFIEKHNDSLITGYLLQNKSEQKTIWKKDTQITLIGYILLFSIALNIYQAKQPPKEHLIASLSDKDSSNIYLTTIPAPVNTIPVVIAWANRAIISSLTLNFADYDNQVKDMKQYFTDAGYAGFIEALDSKYKDNIKNNRMDINTISNAATIVTHMPTLKEPYWILQIPIVTTFSTGTKESSINFNRIVTVKIVPTSAEKNINGKEIDSITIGSV